MLYVGGFVVYNHITCYITYLTNHLMSHTVVINISRCVGLGVHLHRDCLKTSASTNKIWATINLKVHDHRPYQWSHRRGQEWREQGPPHTQLDMRGKSPVICSLAGVASIYLFPNWFWTGQSTESACWRDTILAWNQDFTKTFCLYLFKVLHRT